MSEHDLELIRQREAELRAQLAALDEERRRLEAAERARREAEEAEREATKPIELHVTQRSGGGVIVKGNTRPDVLAVMQDTPGRAWRGYVVGEVDTGLNFFPLTAWPECERRLLALPNVTVTYAKGLREELDWHLNAPAWHIDIHSNERELICTPGPNIYFSILLAIPGAAADWTGQRTKVSIPTSEVWRLWERLENVDGVVWTPAAAALVEETLTRRARLDEIAKKADSDIVIPTLIQTYRPFQRVGVEFIESSGGRVLLADEMGLGKTWQAVGFAERQRANNPRYQTIIICPASLKPNWVREIKKLTGVDAIVGSGGKPDLDHLLGIVQKRAPYVVINYDLIGIVREGEGQEGTDFWPWVQLINMAKPDLIVYDEAHYIKNPDAKRTKGALKITNPPSILPMTGTPVLNRPEELWPSLRLIDPVNFKSRDAFLSTYTEGGKRVKNVESLREALRPIFLRRTKKDVMADLPPINRIYEYHELSDEAQGRYNDVLKGLWTELREFDPHGQGGNQMGIVSILAQLTRMKQVCAADKVERTAELALSFSDSHENGESAKVLIFSGFKGTAYEISRRLGDEALSFVSRTPSDFVTASPEERDNLVQRFRNEPDKRFLIVTEKSAREGHNIEFAQAVIFNDLFWTPAAHEQGEGRAYGRLSNARSIDSYYLVTERTFEEDIMDILAAKMAIIEETVEGVEASRKDVSIVMELIQRMKSQMMGR